MPGLLIVADLGRPQRVPDRALARAKNRRGTKNDAGELVNLAQRGIRVPLGHRVDAGAVRDQRRCLVHVTNTRRAVVDGRRGDVNQARDARIPGGPRQDRRALHRDPVLGLAVGTHRVDRRDDSAGAMDHGRCEVGVIEVANPLLDARKCRSTTGAPYHCAHSSAPIDQRRADTRTHKAVRSGDYTDERLVAA